MATSVSTDGQAVQGIRRVAILFSGGPAPAANAVISTAAASFLRSGIEVLGVFHGYSHLVEYGPNHPLEANRDYIVIDSTVLRRTRNTQGILIGTARTNPGKRVAHPSHLDDPERTAQLRNVYDALCSVEVDALVSIGGDDTLKTANKLKLFQERLPKNRRRIPIVHLPKTIDNDYEGIDFTFGYFTAVETLANEIRNLLADAEATESYFLVQTMGRSAGWLAYGAAMAGEASLVISVEDVVGSYRTHEDFVDVQTGKKSQRAVMRLEYLVERIVSVMRFREESERKRFGVIVMAEGLAEYLPEKFLAGVERDDHGHLNISQVHLSRLFARLVADEYHRQTGRHRRILGLQLGYESRCARPHAFDVMLGSQLGVGAFRALVEERLDGVMVSVFGQLELKYVPFDKLVDRETLVTVVRHIGKDSDFQRLARFLETYVPEHSP